MTRTILLPVLSCFLMLTMALVGGVHADVANNGSPGSGGELSIGLFNYPLHLNPVIHSGAYSQMLGAQLFASPLRYDDQWQPQPYLAETWAVSNDGLSVTLHLVKGATFHDGQPITSADVAFSIMLVKAHHPFNTMFAPVEQVETPHPQIAVIHLSRPHPAILLAMSPPLLPILPQHVYGDGQNIQTHSANMAPVGSGPFQFVEFVSGQHILLKRYEQFFIPQRPRLDTLRFKLSELFDPLALAGGEVHIIPFFDNLQHDLLFGDNPDLVFTTKGYGAIGPLNWLAFNLRQRPFDDIRVRQALAYSIDRTFITTHLFGTQLMEATGPIVPDSPFYSADVPRYAPNVPKANELLDAAGYYRDETGRRFQVLMDFAPVNEEIVLTLVRYLRNDLLRKIGVDLVIRESENFSQWAEQVSNGNFHLTFDVVYNWGDPVIGVHRTYDCDNIRPGVIWSNTQGYCNPEVNALMAAAGQEIDVEKRKALYAEFQKRVVADLPVYFLARIPFLTIHQQQLAGLNDSIWGMLSPLDQVYWSEE